MTPEDRWISSGFLEKESKGENWNKRFFILDDLSLKYYKRKPNPEEPDSEQCRGEIRIKKMCAIQHCRGVMGKDWCFEIRMASGPAILLVAGNYEEMEDWIDNILTHPLFTPARRSSVDGSGLGMTSRTGYTTKVVGGVVIRTQIPANDESPKSQSTFIDTSDSLSGIPTVSTPTVCVDSLSGSMLTSSNSQSSITTWSSQASGTSTGRGHRRDGARVIKAGYCVKQGGRRRTWKKRYFILDPFGLAYYRYRKDKDPIRNVPLPRIVSVGECKSFEDRSNVLQVMTMGRIFYMQCDSDEERREWIDAIQSVAPRREDADLLMLDAMPDGMRHAQTRSNSIGARGMNTALAQNDADPDAAPPKKGGRSNSIGSSFSLTASCSNKGKQLWRLSMGRCRDYLQPMSDDSDDDFDSPVNSLSGPSISNPLVVADSPEKRKEGGKLKTHSGHQLSTRSH